MPSDPSPDDDTTPRFPDADWVAANKPELLAILREQMPDAPDGQIETTLRRTTDWMQADESKRRTAELLDEFRRSAGQFLHEPVREEPPPDPRVAGDLEQRLEVLLKWMDEHAAKVRGSIARQFGGVSDDQIQEIRQALRKRLQRNIALWEPSAFSMEPWVLTTLRFCVKDAIQKGQRELTRKSILLETGETLHGMGEASEATKDLVELMLAVLPERDVDFVVRHGAEGEQIKEIAKDWKLSAAAGYQIYHRAKERIHAWRANFVMKDTAMGRRWLRLALLELSDSDRRLIEASPMDGGAKYKEKWLKAQICLAVIVRYQRFWRNRKERGLLETAERLLQWDQRDLIACKRMNVEALKPADMKTRDRAARVRAIRALFGVLDRLAVVIGWRFAPRHLQEQAFAFIDEEHRALVERLWFSEMKIEEMRTEFKTTSVAILEKLECAQRRLPVPPRNAGKKNNN